MATERNANALSPGTLQAEVISRLKAEGVPVGEESGGFGTIEAIQFQRPAEYTGWIIATTTLSIPYGSDTSLYLFGTEGNAWKLLMMLEANGYATIAGAQGWLQYYVGLVGPGREPYLITTDVPPSWASVWRGLRLRVLRPGLKPELPVMLVRRTLDYFLDEPYQISVQRGGFSLLYLGFSVDKELAGFRGIHYLEYSVAGTRARVVHEAAVDPYNLVRRWAAQDWAIASRSIDTANLENARNWHELFHKQEPGCGLRPIQLGQRKDGNRDVLLASCSCEPSGYVLFAAGRQGFRIVSISQASPLPEEK